MIIQLHCLKQRHTIFILRTQNGLHRASEFLLMTPRGVRALVGITIPLQTPVARSPPLISTT